MKGVIKFRHCGNKKFSKLISCIWSPNTNKVPLEKTTKKREKGIKKERLKTNNVVIIAFMQNITYDTPNSLFKILHLPFMIGRKIANKNSEINVDNEIPVGVHFFSFRYNPIQKKGIHGTSLPINQPLKKVSTLIKLDSREIQITINTDNGKKNFLISAPFSKSPNKSLNANNDQINQSPQNNPPGSPYL